MKKILYWFKDDVGWEIKYHARKIRGFFYDIKYGIESVIYWFPIIWNNRWWDFEFLLDMMKHQLELMEKNWVVNTHHEGDEEIKIQIQTVLDKLEVIMNYDENYYKNFKSYSDKEYMKSEKERYESDCKIVFDTMRNNHRKWWD